MTDESVQEGYDRGVIAGEVATRLAGHDKHFSSINGSLDRIAGTLDQFLARQNIMILEVQRLSDKATASAATVIATASALKDADEARRAQSVTAWSPWQKVLAAIAGIGVVFGMIVGAISLISN